MRTEQLSLFNPRGGNKRNNLILQIFSGQKLSRNPQEILGLSNHRNPILLYTATDSNGTELLQKQTDHTICFDHGYVPIYQRCRKLLLFSNWNKLPPKTSYHQQIESSQMSRRLWAEHPSRHLHSELQLHRPCCLLQWNLKLIKRHAFFFFSSVVAFRETHLVWVSIEPMKCCFHLKIIVTVEDQVSNTKPAS